MITVALIGPDGAGKTTIARRLVETLDVRVKYLYMGINLEASNNMAPTARLLHVIRRYFKRPVQHGPPAAEGADSVNRRISLWQHAKSLLRLVHQLSDEWYRQLVTWRWQRSGYLVLFDRHYYFDYYATDIAPGKKRSLGRRIHGYLLQHCYPHPGLVVYLDAPSAVMFARKGEGTIEILEQRRQGYLRLGATLPNFVVVNANRDIDAVAGDVATAILSQLGIRSVTRNVAESVTL